MQVLKTIGITQQMMNLTRTQGKTIGFVPTMGALHEGHLSLVRAAKAECDVVVVSIFVNPTQFLKGEDYNVYPRDLERDKKMLEREEVDYLFCPEVVEMYPQEEAVSFKLSPRLTGMMCGPFRPGHFEGVAQVCSKLFNIIMPSKVYFGQKDYLQVFVIERLIGDLNFGIQMRVMPTVREKSGLAMSSRNVYLSDSERESALVLSKALFKVRDAYLAGEREEEKLLEIGRKIVESEEGVKLQYIEIHNGVAALAAFVGKIRLIDNVTLS